MLMGRWNLALAPGDFCYRCAILAFIVLLPLPALALGGGTKEKLKSGGYVILMRYAQTQKGPGDPANFDINDCATQRNLADVGRTGVTRIHERFQKAGIKIARAMSSRWCRAIDTAKLLAPAVNVEPRDELAAYLDQKDPALRRQIVGKIRKEIAEWKGPGNLLLVSHKRTIKEVSGRSLSEGGYIVIDPKTLRIIAEDN
jgi:phosphohistidine phosphatase SixA